MNASDKLELLVYIYDIDYLNIKYDKLDKLWHSYYASSLSFGVDLSVGECFGELVSNMESALKSMGVCNG